ncbi:unnamed protein product [Vicia faba]|uniref:Uncharacterized protein n=1 Tax=Vicia faba TaxID=3906 RepID=A0AAV0Z1J4_VICFA|nr:unnamed protein product [Vicia faba]
MPLSRFAAEAFGVVTICLVAILILLGLICIAYSFYFRSRINNQGEIIRLTLLRRALHLKWKETVCKCYIVSSMGFAEPCLFLTLVFLLRAPLQRLETGIMSRKWNVKTSGYIILYCLPMFLLQLFVIWVGPQLDKNKGIMKKLPRYFTSTVGSSSVAGGNDDIALCTYPLLSTVLLGLFAVILTSYLFWLGSRILKLVINKALVFLAFLALVCCSGLCMCTLVYRPIADSLALGNLQDLEARTRRFNDEHNDTASLIANQSRPEDNVEENARPSPGRYSDESTKRGSISFRTMEKGVCSTGTFVELSLFSPSRSLTPPGSPSLPGWPMQSPTQVIGP